MQNKKLIIAIILGITAIVSLIYGVVTPPGRKPGASLKTEALQTGQEVRASKKIVPTKRRATKTEFASWGRNPFVPKTLSRITPLKLTLNGILYHEKKPKAMINNTLVGTGDKIDGNKVVDIKKDKVILNNGTNDFELRLE